ncbi:MAG: hypothetical protein ACI4XF_00385, partial [Oscillospiraceae bacterium]
GVSLGINVNTNEGKAGEIIRPESENDLYKKAIAEYYGFSPETACDEFAEMFGGITRRQYIELAEKRFKK